MQEWQARYVGSSYVTFVWYLAASPKPYILRIYTIYIHIYIYTHAYCKLYTLQVIPHSNGKIQYVSIFFCFFLPEWVGELASSVLNVTKKWRFWLVPKPMVSDPPSGLVKCVLMLSHGSVAPNVHFYSLNPHLDLNGYPCQISVAWRKKSWAPTIPPKHHNLPQKMVGIKVDLWYTWNVKSNLMLPLLIASWNTSRWKPEVFCCCHFLLGVRGLGPWWLNTDLRMATIPSRFPIG